MAANKCEDCKHLKPFVSESGVGCLMCEMTECKQEPKDPIIDIDMLVRKISAKVVEALRGREGCHGCMYEGLSAPWSRPCCDCKRSKKDFFREDENGKDGKSKNHKGTKRSSR